MFTGFWGNVILKIVLNFKRDIFMIINLQTTIAMIIQSKMCRKL